jgi:hypothetical protein
MFRVVLSIIVIDEVDSFVQLVSYKFKFMV